MKVFNIAENFRKNFFASLFLYIGICIILLSLLKCFDPATYSAEIRKERAWKRHEGVRENEYDEIGRAYYDLQNAEESPLGYYIGFIIFGGAIALISNRELTKFSD